MELLSTFIAIATSVSSVELGFLALAAAVFFQWRKTSLAERTAKSASYKEAMDGLLTQINALSNQLNSTREQLDELHDRNVDLMYQLREANSRIAELELILKGFGHNFAPNVAND
jgi:chromosome segregation ATPase